ncbi:hypothetical protein [Alkalicoccobacillus porphyridii]|uniref:Uncharacterized protein n=1 Tax=Alkalicoccobacillus porphyridii TaxID=2597270 RepID=A0A554A1L6_9BACI|nr:hypothetical protein [Alkalicoccobacillus porphyridii]TSB47587.1 hypothetical protein FN960_03430 [Alkalicoccobacillus porphyridii]
MSKRKWLSLGASILLLIGIAIYFVVFYPTSAERTYEKGLTYVEEESDQVLRIYEPEGHEPSIYLFEQEGEIVLLEAAPGENMIQSHVEKNNAGEGISIVTLAGMQRHSAILIDREDAEDITKASLSREGDLVAEFDITNEHDHYSGFLLESPALRQVDTLIMTKKNGETEKVEVSL